MNGRLIWEVKDFEDSAGGVVGPIASSRREAPAMACALLIRERVANQKKRP
jgi:hypothetical protein